MSFYENLLLMIVLIGVGFAAGKFRVLQKEDTKVISNLIFYITTPALVLYNLSTSFEKEQLLEGAVIPFGAAVLTILFSFVAKAAGKALAIPVEKAGLFRAASTFSNTIFLGLPIIVSVFGPESTFYVVLYDLGGTMVLWVLGVLMISGETELKPKETVKAVLNFPLICFIIGLGIVLLSLPVPAFIMRTAQDLGTMTTPLAMVFIGLTLSGASLRAYRSDRSLIAVSILKLLVMPMIALTCLYFLPLSPLVKKIMVLEAAMPVMITTAIVAKKYEKDYEYVTQAVVMTTLLFFLTVPVFTMLLNRIF